MRYGIISVLFWLVAGCVSSDSLEGQDLLEEEVLPMPQVCQYQSESYQVGEAFASTDGCNECLCEPGNKVVCTLKACKPVDLDAIEQQYQSL